MAVLNKATDYETILLEGLKNLNRGAKIEEVYDILEKAGVPYSERIAKETVWKLVEEGRAKFNNKWLLEIHR